MRSSNLPSNLRPNLPARLPHLLALVLVLALVARPAHALPAFPALPASLARTSERVHHWLHWGGNLHAPSAAPWAAHPSQPRDARVASRPPLPSFVQGAGAQNRSAGQAMDYAIAMMHRPELDLIASYLRPSDVYLEYGTGGSTINLAPLVRLAYSIEHNCEWMEYVRQSLNARGVHYANLRMKCVEMPPGFRGWGTHSNYEHANYEQFKEYVDAVTMLPERQFDRVLIDGRARMACALRILPFLHDDSLVFIHDFYSRTHLYSGLLPYYTEVARIRAVRNTDPSLGPIDEPQGLIVLRRRPDATHPLPDSIIHARYAAIDWREPFGEPLVSLPARIRYYASLALDAGRWKRARHVHGLVELVRSDLLRLAMLYGVVMFFARNWRALVALGGRTSAMSASGVAPTPLAKALSVPCGAKGEGAREARVLVGGVSEPSRRNVGAEGAGSMSKSQSAGRAEVGAGAKAAAPRFVETEGMKVASARRMQRLRGQGK